MWKIIRKRLIMLIFVVFGVSLLTFLMANVMPGDPARMIVGQRASEEVYRKVREQLGLNDMLPVQYTNYMKGLLCGDLGTSILTQRPVLEDLLDFFPATLELAACAFLIAIVVGIILGVITAVYNNTIWDVIGRFIAIGGVSIPVFLSGLVAILVFNLLGDGLRDMLDPKSLRQGFTCFCK